MYPEEHNAIRAVYDAVVTKMASDGANPNLFTRAAEPAYVKLAHESELTRKFKTVLDIVNG